MREPSTGGVRIVDLAEDGVSEADLLVHDAHAQDPTTAFAISRLTDAGVLSSAPIGIFRQVEQPTYDDLAREQVTTAQGTSGDADARSGLAGLLASGDTWTVA